MLSSGSLWCSKRVKYAQRTDATWIHCRALPQKAVLFQRTVWTSYFEHENKPCHMFPKSGGNSAQVPAGLLREFAPEMSWGQLHGEQFDPRRFHPKRLWLWPGPVELCHTVLSCKLVRCKLQFRSDKNTF